MRIIFHALLLVTSCICFVPAYAGDILVKSPWIREAPPTAKALAAYMVITNNGTQQVSLLEVTSPNFGSVEIHQTTMHQGMMHMTALKSLAINPGETVRLEPGGFHIMLLDPRNSVRPGDQFELRLHFDLGEDLIVPVVVQTRQEH